MLNVETKPKKVSYCPNWRQLCTASCLEYKSETWKRINKRPSVSMTMKLLIIVSVICLTSAQREFCLGDNALSVLNDITTTTTEQKVGSFSFWNSYNMLKYAKNYIQKESRFNHMQFAWFKSKRIPSRYNSAVCICRQWQNVAAVMLWKFAKRIRNVDRMEKLRWACPHTIAL